MALHLVTGYAGAAHVTAEDIGSLQSSIFGVASCFLPRGNKMAAQVISNNQIRILDGDMCLQGRFIRLAENTYQDLTIDNGAQGFNRNDLIVIRYEKNADTGIESVSFKVIKGTAASGTATDPEYTAGDLLTDHDLVAEVPIYRIPIANLTVGTPVRLAPVLGYPVNDTATVNGKPLSSNPVLNASDVGALPVGYLPPVETLAFDDFIQLNGGQPDANATTVYKVGKLVFLTASINGNWGEGEVNFATAKARMQKNILFAGRIGNSAIPSSAPATFGVTPSGVIRKFSSMGGNNLWFTAIFIDQQ